MNGLLSLIVAFGERCLEDPSIANIQLAQELLDLCKKLEKIKYPEEVTREDGILIGKFMIITEMKPEFLELFNFIFTSMEYEGMVIEYKNWKTFEYLEKHFKFD